MRRRRFCQKKILDIEPRTEKPSRLADCTDDGTGMIWLHLNMHNLEQRQVFYNKNVPIQSGSEMNATLLFGPTSIQSFPSFTTGHDFLHSWLHFFGLHLLALTMAILVRCSSLFPSFFCAFFGMFLKFAVDLAGVAIYRCLLHFFKQLSVLAPKSRRPILDCVPND